MGRTPLVRGRNFVPPSVIRGTASAVPIPRTDNHVPDGGMSMKRLSTALLAALAIFLSAAPARAQQQTGEIFGKVTDESGAVLPGVSVTLTGPSLLQPLTAVTSETGSFQFPRLAVGTYTVKFELAGFKTVIKEDLRVTVG